MPPTSHRSPNPHRPLRRTPIAALLCGLALTLSPAAWGQSLKDLYEAARAYDATYLSAKSLADSAVYRVEQSEALKRPNAALVGNATTSEVDRPSPFNGLGNSTSIGATVQGRYPLINPANDVLIAQSRKSLEIAKADLETAEQDLIVRVAQAYFDVLAAQDSLTTTRASKAAITEQLASAKRKFEVGTATITDARAAQARYDLALASEIGAENELRTKSVALDQLVGRTAVAPKQLLVPVVLPPVLPSDADAWVAAADRQHPSIRKARIGLEVAELETARARAAEKYTLDAVGSVGSTHASGGLAAPHGLTTTASVGLQFNLPLYTGGATQSRIKETLVLEQKSRNDLDAARRGVTQSTRVAYLGVQSLQATVKALEAAESSSLLSLESAKLGYSVGVSVNLDVLDAQTQLFQTRRDLAKARYDVLMTGLRLRQASGQLDPGAIEAVNALLAP